jgi:hypothetical protein
MPDLPKIAIPSVEKINKFPWASVCFFMMGIIAFLLYVVINNSGDKNCQDDKKAANLRADKATEEIVRVLQENLMYARKQDSVERSNKSLRDTIVQAKSKVDVTSSLTIKAVSK